MTASRRRWSYSLRTLFVGMTLICCWLGYQVNWIHQRHNALKANPVHRSPLADDPFAEAVAAPGCLWLFGEQGVATIFRQGKHQGISDAEWRQSMQRLFPEATIYP